ncbi:MAG: hypothetical protein ABIS50_15975 [Luteolibacter sp.]|uniref:hypothetical protein n=1 Tax=Luteolibacter sp. TaxID=1962973 RepID=UPI00326543E4
MDKIVSLSDFSVVVRQLADGSESDFVVIGGLAVGAWAQYFGIPTDGPIFSKDIDLRGGRLLAQAFGQGMRLQGCQLKGFVTATRNEPPGLGKNYVIPLVLPDGRETVIEVLEAMPWVDDGPDRPYGFGVIIDGIPLLDPLSLFIGKLHAWHPGDLPEVANNDRIHLELLAKIIPAFSSEAEQRGLDISERKNALKAILDAHKTPVDTETAAAFFDP